MPKSIVVRAKGGKGPVGVEVWFCGNRGHLHAKVVPADHGGIREISSLPIEAQTGTEEYAERATAPDPVVRESAIQALNMRLEIFKDLLPA